MHLCFLLQDLERADEGKLLRLAGAGIDDAEDRKDKQRQRNKRRQNGEQAAKHRHAADDQIDDAADDTPDNARNKEDKPLIRVETRELRVRRCQQRDEEENADIRKQRQYLVFGDVRRVKIAGDRFFTVSSKLFFGVSFACAPPTGAPQPSQNFAPSGSSFPHFSQNIVFLLV